MSSIHLSSSSKFINVTPSDTALLKYVSDVTGSLEPIATRGILLGVAGDLEIKDDNGTTVVLVGLAAGVLHPITTQQILAANTTATSISAYF